MVVTYGDTGTSRRIVRPRLRVVRLPKPPCWSLRAMVNGLGEWDIEVEVVFCGVGWLDSEWWVI